jgi:elongation factor Ts
LIQEGVLLEQSFIKDSGKTIKDLIDEITGKVGEKIVIRRYQRYQLGEDLKKN